MSGFDLSQIRSVEAADVAGKRVLVRVDLNVPMQDGVVTDATRIERILPTVRLLAERGAKVILLSHFGRPKGKRVPEDSLKPVAAVIRSRMPATDVRFVPDCVGPDVARELETMQPGDVAVLENLRYHAGEEKNDEAFASELAALGDIYVNDAFSAAHRAHASTVAITKLLPTYAGLSMIAEIEALQNALEKPQRPVIAIVGGSKVSTKIDVLSNLARKVDLLVVGGGMANTFLFADGIDVGKSLCETDAVDTVKAIQAVAAKAGCEIVLPKDGVVAEALAPGVSTETVSISAVPAASMILDVGPETVADLVERLKAVKTLLWNGPLGAFEIATFANGTHSIMRTLAESNAITIVGGGDTDTALHKAGLFSRMSYVSTGGGAFLELLEGKRLPGIVALEE